MFVRSCVCKKVHVSCSLELVAQKIIQKEWKKLSIQLLLFHIKSTGTYTMKRSSFKYSPRAKNMLTSQRTIVSWLLFSICSVNNIVVFLHVFQKFCFGKIKKNCFLIRMLPFGAFFNVMMTIMTITWRAKVNLGFSFIREPIVFELGVGSQCRTDVVQKCQFFDLKCRSRALLRRLSARERGGPQKPIMYFANRWSSVTQKRLKSNKFLIYLRERDR